MATMRSTARASNNWSPRARASLRWGAVIEGQPGVSIGSDNALGGLEATRHLLAGTSAHRLAGDSSRHYPEFQARAAIKAPAGSELDAHQQTTMSGKR